jgi:hypothetical protein
MASASARPTSALATPGKTARAPVVIIGLLLAAGAGAAYFLIAGRGGPKTGEKSGETSTTSPAAVPTEPAPTAAAPEGTATANPENAAAPAGAPANAPAAGTATEKGANDKAAAEAKPTGGTATPASLRARAPSPEPTKESAAAAAEAKPPEVSAAPDHGPAHRGPKHKGGAARSAEAAPAVADVSPKPPGDAPAPPTTDAPAAKESKSSAALKITTTPAGAEVILDGNSVGKTPLLAGDVDPGAPHVITLKKDGFEAHEHMISSSDWPRPHNGVRTLKVNVKLRSTSGGEAAKPAESGEGSPLEPPPGLGTTPASPKRE